MADFDKCIEFVLHNEDATLSGKVTTDAGGRTRFGIAEKFHPNIGDEFFTEPAAEALAKAKDIYYHEYWPCVAGAQIESEAVAAKLLDMAVNMGVHQAIVLLQRTLDAGLREDGALGDKTLAVLNQADPGKLLPGLCEACVAFYQHLAAVRPETEEYLQGWLSRARSIPNWEEVSA